MDPAPEQNLEPHREITMTSSDRIRRLGRIAAVAIAATPLFYIATARGVAPSLHAQQEAPVTLRLKGTEGQTTTYRFQQDIDLNMPIQFGGSQAVHSLIVIQQTVQYVTADTIRYLAEVKDIVVEMGSSPVGGMDFSQFKGQQFRLALSPRGKVLEVESSGPDEVGTEQLRQSMQQVGFPVLPAQSIRVGDSWVDTTRVDAAAMALPANGEIVSVNSSTLKKLSRSGDISVAEILVETTFSFEPHGASLPGMRVAMNGSRTDQVRFDVTNGRFLEAKGTQDFVMSMAIPGAPGSLSIEGTAKSVASLQGR